MATDDTATPDFPRVDPLPHLSGGSTTAPWAGRRMYASGHPGAGIAHSRECETGGSLALAETAVWGVFLNRIIKGKNGS